MKKLLEKQSGFILPISLLLMVVLMIVALAVITFNLQFYRDTDRNKDRSQAFLAAESGIEFAVQELNQTPPGDGVFSETNFINNDQQGRVTYSTTATTGSNGQVTIISTGRVYLPADSSEPVATRRIKAIVVGTSDEGNTAVWAGQHLEIGGNATIANGAVVVNGTLKMSGSSKIGTAQTPVTVRVAHNACPVIADSSYPSSCSSGQPISMNSASNHIYGEVRANNQTSYGSYMSNPGLVGNSGVSSRALDGDFLLSQHDRDAQKSAVSQTISASSASCTGNYSRVWQANTHITGGTVNVRSSCNVTIEGDVWVDGDIQLNGNGDIKVDESLTEAPTIMIDGSDGLSMSGSGKILANANDIGVRVLVYYSTASCNPDCTNVTGVDLANSESIETIRIGGGSNNAPASFFYSVWTRAYIGSGVSIGSVAGQEVYMAGAGNVTFGGELSSGDKVWTIKNYQRL